METSKRNGNIELLRIVFCVSVLFLHAGFPSFPMAGGYLGVEFFFMVTGAFMAKALRPKHEEQMLEPMKETLHASKRYLVRRVKSVFPVFLISTIIGTCVAAFVADPQQIGYSWYPFLFINDLLFAQNYGFQVLSATGVLWYLSATFFAQWLLYPIIRRKYDVYVGYAAPMVALLLYGILVASYGHLEMPNTWWLGVVNTGFMRGIAGITLGAFCYEMSQKLALAEGLGNKWLLGCIEACAYAVVLVYICWGAKRMQGVDGTAVFLLAVGMTITLSERSVFHGRFNHDWVYKISEMTTALFLNHFYWITGIDVLLEKLPLLSLDEIEKKWLAVLLSLVTAVAVQGIVKGVQRLYSCRHREHER